MKYNIFLIVGGSKDQEILWIINKLKFIEDNLFILFTDKKNVLLLYAISFLLYL